MYSGLSQTSRMNYFSKNKNNLNQSFLRTFHVRCLRGSFTRSWLSYRSLPSRKLHKSNACPTLPKPCFGTFWFNNSENVLRKVNNFATSVSFFNIYLYLSLLTGSLFWIYRYSLFYHRPLNFCFLMRHIGPCYIAGHGRNYNVVICASVLLLLSPHAKWYNVHRSKNSSYSTTLYQTISWKFSKNYKSYITQKPLWMVTLSWQVIFLLRQWHRRFKNQEGETMGHNNGQHDFFVWFQQL